MAELKRHLALFGYRGSGKTTTAKLLAHSLAVPWVDTDERVVQAYNGLSIKQIWEDFGEAHFRETEARECIRILEEAPCIIALGGGAVIQQAVREAYHHAQTENRLTCIYLHAEVSTLYERIHGDAHSAANRPAMSRFGGGMQEITEILQTRDPIYRSAADEVIHVDQHSPTEVQTLILQALSPLL